MTRKERLSLRNEKVRSLFNSISKKNPKWRANAVIEEIEILMFLSTRTIEAILNEEGIYSTEPIHPK